MVSSYTPDRGDIVMLRFSPHQGREQAGARPAIILSPRPYNQKVGLVVACPITRQEKGYPFEVRLPKRIRTRGVILSDHMKSLDWRARKARFIERAPKETVAEALAKICTLLMG